MPPINFGEKSPDIGYLKQSTDSDEKEWQVGTGSTPNRDTGPSSDHTNGSGYYAYLEASGIAIGSRVCALVRLLFNLF